MGNHTGEVLVEETAGQVLSHEIMVRDADVVKRHGRQQDVCRYGQKNIHLAGSETLSMQRSSVYGTWEVPGKSSIKRKELYGDERFEDKYLYFREVGQSHSTAEVAEQIW